jgi:antibiotic biosynthesis monooxygenase (ABM) superfamily enzyme
VQITDEAGYEPENTGIRMLRSYKHGRLMFCVLVFAAVYPLVTGLSYLMQRVAESWPLWQRHLLIVPLIMLAMVFVIIPAIQALVVRLSKSRPLA